MDFHESQKCGIMTMNFFQQWKKKKQYNEEEAYQNSIIEITAKDSLFEYPLGELMGKAATTKSAWKNKNTIFCTSGLSDWESLLAMLMQSVKNGHSIVCVDVDGQIYQKTQYFLKGNGYHIKLMDIDEDDSNTWSIFEEMTDIYSIADRSKKIIDILKWNILPREKAADEYYTNGLSVTMAAILAYILSDNLLTSNKFQKAYELLNHNTTRNLDNLFSVSEDTPKSLWFDFKNEYIEEYIQELLRIFDILRDDARNHIINDEDINIARIRFRKTVYFLNFIGDTVEDNVPLNLFLNFVLQKAVSLEKQYQLMKENGQIEENHTPLIPMDFFILDMDVHPDLNQFIYAMRHQAEGCNINLFMSCVDAQYMYENYYMVSDELVEMMQYIILQTNDRQNKESIMDMLELQETIPSFDSSDEEVIISMKEYIPCGKYHIRNHPLYAILTRK